MKMRKIILLVMILALLCVVLAACGSQDGNTNAANAANTANTANTENNANAANTAEVPDTKAPVKDGTYSAKFDTDSSMFHVNEAHKGRGTLTVKDGQMTLHVALASKSIVNLYRGTSEEAQKEGAKILQPTTDTVKYSDGSTEEVYGFDIPVPYIDEEFECALLGSKGKWYSHKVSVSDLKPVE